MKPTLAVDNGQPVPGPPWWERHRQPLGYGIILLGLAAPVGIWLAPDTMRSIWNGLGPLLMLCCLIAILRQGVSPQSQREPERVPDSVVEHRHVHVRRWW